MAPKKTRRSHGTSISSTGSLLQDLPATSSTLMMGNDNQDVALLSLSEALYARRAEYIRPDSVRVKVGTWNAGAQKNTDEDVAKWFIDAEGVDKKLGGLVSATTNGGIHESETLHKREEIGIYALNLQEIVDVSAVSEALRPYTDPSNAKKWKDAVQAAIPQGYELVAEQQMIGLLLLVYVSAEIAQSLRGVSVTSVGTGLGGVMGNKGAVAARIVIGESTRVLFVNSHLAAGADKTALDRRNWDAAQVVSRARFNPLTDLADVERGPCDRIGEEDFAFWTGDLNYRLEGIPGDDVRRLLTLHSHNKFDLDHESDSETSSKLGMLKHKLHKLTTGDDSSPERQSIESSNQGTTSGSNVSATTVDEALPAHEDPASLLTTLTSLLPHDELHQQMKQRKAFYDGWREGPITFLPTYKYDVGSFGVFDSSDKKRAPSFCDRILFRTRGDKKKFDRLASETVQARKKDAQMRAHGADQAADDEGILYDYDPENDGDEDDDDQKDINNDQDELREQDNDLTQENYTTYQNILTSDHKPMSAEFMLRYETIDPVQRAKVHAEVVKKYDNAENETRPRVTIIADNPGPRGSDGSEGIHFGDIRWAQAKHRTLTIANTGRTPANFNLIGRPTEASQESGIAPEWLSIKLDDEQLDGHAQESGLITLEPGDTINLSLEIEILDMQLTHAVNTGATRLDDVLVLRIKEGRDHFISIQAEWQTTFLCHSIDELIRVPDGGIRKLQHVQNGVAPTLISPTMPVCVSAPRELFRLIEAIELTCSQVVAEWEMSAGADTEAPWDDDAGWPFSERSWSTPDDHRHAVLSAICDAVDCNRAITDSFPVDTPVEARLYLLCEMLLIFLRSLPDGVLTPEMSKQLSAHYAQAEKAKQRPTAEVERNAVQEILVKAGAAHNISFVLLTTMLQRVLRELKMAERAKKELSSPIEEKSAGTLRRMTGLVRSSKSQHEHIAEAIQEYADIFSSAAFKSPTEGSEAVKALSGRRRVDLFRLFLTSEDPM